MHETNPIEHYLRQEAERISKHYEGAAVVIVVGESQRAGINRCMTGSSLHQGEGLSELLGLLEASKQVTTYKHMVKPRK